jgi:phage terminase small subunit
MSRKLTSKQEAYKNSRIQGMGVSESYRASYKADGMSDKAVSKEATKLEKDPRIAPAIREKREEATSSAVMTRQEALEKLSLSARVSITDVAEFKVAQVGEDDNGLPVYQTVWEIKNSEDIAPEVAACIKSITITKTGPKLELHDQNSAIKQLSEMEGWNSATKHEHSGPGGKPIVTRVERIIVSPSNTNR